MTSRELRAQNALKAYYSASGVNKPFSDLEAIVLLRAPRFYSQFGASIEFSGLTDTRVAELMKKLASKNYGKWPDSRETNIFFDALLDEMGSFSNKISIVSDAVKETASDVTSYAKVGVSLYILAGAVALGFILYSRGKK